MAELDTIRHVSDPVEAEMLVDLLSQEGIRATVPGNEHNALMGGALGAALNVPLRVRADQADEARAILSALDDYDEVDPHDAAPNAPDASEMEGGGPYRGARRIEDTTPPRKKGVAMAVGICLPLIFGAFGAAHFYVRSYGRGFGLLATAWVFGFLAINGQVWAWAVPPLVMIADVYGAVSNIAARDRQH